MSGMQELSIILSILAIGISLGSVLTVIAQNMALRRSAQILAMKQAERERRAKAGRDMSSQAIRQRLREK